jgi:short-subunit dehydrogenase
MNVQYPNFIIFVKSDYQLLAYLKFTMKKVILITGASSGIGKETAKLLIDKNYTIYGAARRLDKMQDLKAIGVKLIEMDVTNDTSMVKGIDEIIQNEGRLDILVNNAGYGAYGAVEDVPISEARYQFEVNIFGLARLTQLVLPQMRAQKRGKIINISSVAGNFGEPYGAWYHATKFALEGLSDSLRMELKPFHIDVVIIQPGMIFTEWNAIAREGLIKTSGNTAYKEYATRHAKFLEKEDKSGSHPMVIAKLIVKAILSNNPKTRYSGGAHAKQILFFKKILPDKVFDYIFLSQIK